MADRRTILEVKEITDCDTGMYRMGEIDTVPDEQVRDYILRRGEFGYTEMLDFCASVMRAAKNARTEYIKLMSQEAACTDNRF